MTENQPPAVRKPRLSLKAAVIIGSIVVALIVGGRLLGEASVTPADVASKACTESYVPSRLKSPTTASFSNIRTAEKDKDYFSVFGSVDAQNGFGATVRAAFYCQVHVRDGKPRMIEVQVS